LESCVSQLDAYFAGTLRDFSVPLSLEGTEFRRRCWAALRDIPYGETRSYRDIAKATGNIKAVRAVGGANHNNPVSIIVPCHRVIGSDGSMTGYGGGLWRKEWLLNHERK
jgi:methylated-DNA-[protein]-cysteine S-methyltransferase